MVLVSASRLSKQRPSGLEVESNLCFANDILRTELVTLAGRSGFATSSSKMLARCREVFNSRDTDDGEPTTIVFIICQSQRLYRMFVQWPALSRELCLG